MACTQIEINPFYYSRNFDKILIDEPCTNHVALKYILSESEHRRISFSIFFAELTLSDYRTSIRK